jgi:hypothetical protein
MVQVARYLYSPCSMSNMFDSRLWGINKDLKLLVLLRAATVCWTIWLHQNDIVFEEKNMTNSLQVVQLVIHWLHI